MQNTFMKPIDSNGLIVVQSGVAWNHSMPPCSKQAISLLERNTKVVTWLMKPGGDAHDQIPCIKYKEKYYSLSLRMQKAIYRHIRLKKGFQNLENMDGMTKLRIPDVLLKEKMRTQSRFDAMRSAQKRQQSSDSAEENEQDTPSSSSCAFVSMNEKKGRKREFQSDDAAEAFREQKNKKSKAQRTQVMQNDISIEVIDNQKKKDKQIRQDTAALLPLITIKKQKKNEKKERIKNTNTIASKMKQVVDKLIQEQRMQEFKPLLTVFLYKSQQSEIISLFLHEIRKENINLFHDKERLFSLIMSKYDDFSSAINDKNPCAKSHCLNMLSFSIG